MTNKKSKLRKGICAIITGASSGIGREFALQLTRRYAARLVLNARDENKLKDVARRVEAMGGTAVCIAEDIAKEGSSELLVKTCLENFASLDLIFNNAGLTAPGPFTQLSVTDWRYVFEVNFFAPLSLTYAALPHFQEKQSGAIVNIASVAGKVALPGSVCYASSKFALTGLSEGLAAELGKLGIDVLTVCPGFVRTEFFTKNKTADNPTATAEEPGLKGWLTRNLLSISSEECVEEILQALKQGGSRELVLTMPGKTLERLNGICPSLMHFIASKIPPDRKKGRL